MEIEEIKKIIIDQKEEIETNYQKELETGIIEREEYFFDYEKKKPLSNEEIAKAQERLFGMQICKDPDFLRYGCDFPSVEREFEEAAIRKFLSENLKNKKALEIGCGCDFLMIYHLINEGVDIKGINKEKGLWFSFLRALKFCFSDYNRKKAKHIIPSKEIDIETIANQNIYPLIEYIKRTNEDILKFEKEINPVIKEKEEEMAKENERLHEAEERRDNVGISIILEKMEQIKKEIGEETGKKYRSERKIIKEELLKLKKNQENGIDFINYPIKEQYDFILAHDVFEEDVFGDVTKSNPPVEPQISMAILKKIRESLREEGYAFLTTRSSPFIFRASHIKEVGGLEIISWGYFDRVEGKLNEEEERKKSSLKFSVPEEKIKRIANVTDIRRVVELLVFKKNG